MSMSDPQPSLNGRFLTGYAHDPSPPLPERPQPRLALQASAPVVVRPEVILGESSLLPFHFLRTGDRLGRAVVKITRGDGASGTGFLVAPDILLTNHHVLPDMATAAAARALAHHEDKPTDGLPAPEAVEVPLAPDLLFVTQGELDFTFCGVRGLEDLGAVPMGRDSLSIDTTDVVNIIQHPRGRPKEVAIRDNRVVKADRVVLHYICDTEPGSSGSPVFDNHWRLVALHHASILAEKPAGGGLGVPVAEPVVRFLNEGVRLSAIALALEMTGAVEAADLGMIARLRALFREPDPVVGFFGALGHSARGRSVAGIVAEIDRPRGVTLDVGFWDFRAAPRLNDHLDDLGWTMSAMGLDLWCLGHVSPVQARAVAEHLDTNFRLEYRHLPGRGSMAILARKSRAISAERVEEAGLDVVRVRVRDASGHEPTIRVLPLTGRVPMLSRERVDVIRAASGRERPGDWLLLGGSASRPHDTDLAGLSVSFADGGPDGGLILLRGPESAVADLFATPNLAARGDMKILRDRCLPPTPRRLTMRSPLAARLVLGR